MIKLYLEGIADEKFFNDYLDHLKTKGELENRDDFYIEIIGGIDEDISITLRKLQPDIERPSEYLLVFVFDSDNLYNERKAIFKQAKLANFLLPNDSNNGDLETLLENIIAEKNKGVIECWKQYEICLGEKKYNIPANKTKIYGYIEALVGRTKKEKDKIKEPNRDYRNVEHFNLDSEYLNPLKGFLKTLKSPVI